MMDAAKTAPGWYGKLPSLGDFASRRLAAEFIESWDAWLGAGMAAQREALGEAWLDAYLQGPTWRFVLMPGAVPGLPAQHALAGVLMPSVDRVGRYFPLTVATALARLPQSAAELELLLAWLHRLEDLALDALQDDWTIDELEQALDQLPELETGAAATPSTELEAAGAALVGALASDAAFVALEGVANRTELAALLAGAVARATPGGWQQAASGKAFWLADNPLVPRLLVSNGLPGHAEFVQMLGSSGREPGAATSF